MRIIFVCRLFFPEFQNSHQQFFLSWERIDQKISRNSISQTTPGYIMDIHIGDGSCDDFREFVINRMVNQS